MRGRYGDGNGLYLLVRAPDAKFWVFRYTRHGRMREMGLGRAGNERGAVPLAEARERAGSLHSLVRRGVDPLEQRDAEAAAARAAAQEIAARSITFEVAAERYMEHHAPGWRNPKHVKQWRNTLATYAYPHIGSLIVGAIETAHVLAVLEPIWTRKPETASRLRGRIEAVLDHARAREWREGENPARWRGHLSETLLARSKIAPVRHHAALAWKDVGSFLVELRKQRGVAALALEFAILTAARSGEVRGAKWDEVDLVDKVWIVPAARMKAGKEHRVPLSDAAVSVLKRVHVDHKHGDSVIFVTPRSAQLSDMALAMVLRRMNRTSLTVHGFRSSFRDWVGESTSYPREVAEAALAHTLGDKVEAAYRRGDLFDKRRRLMDEWAKFASRPFATQPVVSMRR